MGRGLLLRLRISSRRCVRGARTSFILKPSCCVSWRILKLQARLEGESYLCVGCSIMVASAWSCLDIMLGVMYQCSSVPQRLACAMMGHSHSDTLIEHG